ncbi:hypothetical protein [Streptomyces bohaiensis]|uniref:Uncharacterized protein n=1 Tax=Streptomyces bohaiensis TaxID=1431344 RepID=A0ABX1CIN1_9ACTN|nr:hypothetical protein [Streptomyces bohaiensis]NJQ17645.1 hypothetical protein [Streptomyces bohaiensis]
MNDPLLYDTVLPGAAPAPAPSRHGAGVSPVPARRSAHPEVRKTSNTPERPPRRPPGASRA